jgi:hypothetical protein
MMSVQEMETLQLDLNGSTNLERAQEEARSAASKGSVDGLRLIAWYDRERQTGGPTTACKGEVPKCVRDYASSHGAHKRVWLNDGAYEFYFAETGDDVEELDEKWAVRVHEHAKTMEHANVQGG